MVGHVPPTGAWYFESTYERRQAGYEGRDIRLGRSRDLSRPASPEFTPCRSGSCAGLLMLLSDPGLPIQTISLGRHCPGSRRIARRRSSDSSVIMYATRWLVVSSRTMMPFSLSSSTSCEIRPREIPSSRAAKLIGSPVKASRCCRVWHCR